MRQRTTAEAGAAVIADDRARARRGVGYCGDGRGIRQVALQAALLHVQLLQPPQQLVAPLLQGRAVIKGSMCMRKHHKILLLLLFGGHSFTWHPLLAWYCANAG